MDLNRRTPRLDPSRFSMVPRADVPRSTFVTTHSHKTTFKGGYLIPIHVDEVLPGDVHQGQLTIFARLPTMVFPVMDNMTLETAFFFVPCRLLWTNWRKFMGERDNPGDSISFVIPTFDAQGGPPCSIFDYMGIPGVGQLTGGQDLPINAMPFRAYNLIWNEWYRDQNLQNAIPVSLADTDTAGNFALKRRNKKHDYFTSALPWPLKGGVEISIPLQGQALVKGIGTTTNTANAGVNMPVYESGSGTSTVVYPDAKQLWNVGTGNIDATWLRMTGAGPNASPLVYADMSTLTGQTINAIRLAFQTQRLLERDARSGTRYTELLRAHFGVDPEDTRLQRPEYIGGGRTAIQTQAIPQTSATSITGSGSPLGALGAAATANDQHSFTLYAKEHGYIIGLAHVTADLTYQQGLHRMWTRQTRYDFYWPVFAHLGEQIIRNDEIYCTGSNATDGGAFGYQERWAEYRHRPSRISGLFRSRSAGTIDPWHLAQNFAALPTLNDAFIQDDPPIARALAAGPSADNMQVLFDSVFRIKTTRAMPMFSVPGGMDRF